MAERAFPFLVYRPRFSPLRTMDETMNDGGKIGGQAPNVPAGRLKKGNDMIFLQSIRTWRCSSD